MPSEVVLHAVFEALKRIEVYLRERTSGKMNSSKIQKRGFVKSDFEEHVYSL